MMQTIHKTIIVLIISALWSQAPPRYYRLEYLGVLDEESPYSTARAINDSCVITGYSFSDYVDDGDLFRPYINPFRWQNGEMEDLGFDGVAFDINNLGQIVGSQYDDAFVWQDGIYTELYEPWGWGIDSGAGEINDNGLIVGSIEYDPTGLHAAIWQDDYYEFFTIFDGNYSVFTGVNNNDIIIGYVRDEDNKASPFIWIDGQATLLDTLSGSISCFAASINDNQQIVGHCYTEDLPGLGFPHPVLWENGECINLDTMNIFHSCRLTGINNSGQIVGNGCYDNSGYPYACLFEDGNIYDLNNLIDNPDGWTLREVYDINNYGYIVGRGIYPEISAEVAFLLIPLEIGDVNADGEVNIGDVIMLVGIILGFTDPVIYGDIYYDEIVDLSDIILLIQIILND